MKEILDVVRFEVFMAVTTKNSVFWDIKIRFVPHRRHITPPLHSPAGKCYARLEVFTVVTMKNAVFWNVTLVALVRTYVREEYIASIIKVTRIGDLETTLAVTSNRRTLRRNT
jgi:hypothetical protein